MNTDPSLNPDISPAKETVDKIEILSVDLLDQHREKIAELRELARSLGLDFGWHYLLDITWILSNLGAIGDNIILDAGAGTGVIQWYLAQQGATVISVDRTSRADLPIKFRRRFRVRGMRNNDLIPARQRFSQELTRDASIKKKFRTFGRDITNLMHTPSTGRVIIYNRDLSKLTHITSSSVDAVVAVSALEHNTPECLKEVVMELMRVLKPGGYLLATLCAARDQDWYHEPSSGWCYTSATLREVFDLDRSATSNFSDYDRLFDQLVNCTELSENLAPFYYKSANNGMPYGVWDPQYQPVGVRKQKRGPLE